MSSRMARLACVSLLGGVVLFGCTEATPDYCQKSADCPSGWICDVARAVCISPLDGAAGSLDATDAPAGEDVGGALDVSVTVDVPVLDEATEAGMPEDSGTVDVFVPDVYVPDGGGTCGANSDCLDPTMPFCVGNVCVGCQAAATTACGTQVCDGVSGRCVECTADGQCTKDAAKGFCVANACTGCATSGATGCAARGDGRTTCATSGSAAGQCVECAGDADCKDATKSFCVANACGGCQTAAATACSTRLASKPVCSTSGDLAGQCVECFADADCKNATKSFCVASVCGGCQTAAATACSTRSASSPVCATGGDLAGQCVECSADADCKDATKSFCVANACGGCQTAAATACSTRSASSPVCATSGTASGTCVECSADADCKDATKRFCVANACGGCQTAAATACSARSASMPVCATSGALSGQCVVCQVDDDCTVPSAPICNASNACIACTADSQCIAKLGADPGVCMAHQDGRCATDAETIYVTTSALQAAVTLIGTNTSKHLIVLRSPADVISVTSAMQVSIVGQGTASIHPSVGSPGITLSGMGNLYARDLSVIGGSDSNLGISAGAGTTLRLERVKVLSNSGGGILLDGAAFDFSDVLASGNGVGIDGTTLWSGVYVRALPNAGSATKLNFISVVNNGSPGLQCNFAVPTVAGSNVSVYASGNGGTGGVDVIPICGLTSCTPALAGTCGSSLTP